MSPIKRQPPGRRPEDSRKEFYEFLEKTTIPGLAQIFTHKSMAWRIAWATVVICGFIMAVYQSLDVLNAYLNRSIVQVISFEKKTKLIFPAATFCTNMLIDYGIADLPENLLKLSDEVEKEVVRSMPDVSALELGDIINDYRTKTLSEILKHNNKTQSKIFGNYKFFRNCIWTTEPCNYTTDFITYFSLQYGKCMTYNAGLGTKLKKAAANEGLIGVIDMNLKGRNRLLNSDYGVLIIHPASSPPITTLQNVVNFYPGNTIKIFLQGKSIHRLKTSHIKNCLHEDEIKNYQDFHYLGNIYQYSVMGCDFKCYFDYISETTCVPTMLDPETVNNTLAKYSSRNIPLCNYTEFATGADENQFDCECPKQCKAHEIQTSETTSPNMHSYETHEENSDTEALNATKKINAKYAIIQIVYESTEYMRIREEPKISQADFWGTCGGNISLWVGLTMLCFMEVVELFILLFRWKIRFLQEKMSQGFKN